MKMSEYLSKKKVLLIITVFLIAVVIIASIFTLLKKGIDRSKVQEQELSINYNLNKDKHMPMNKEEGEQNVNPSTITIKNNKKYKQDYKIVIKSKDNSTLEINKVYIRINNETKLLSDYIDGEVYQNSIDAKSEQKIEFQIWIASDLLVHPDDDEKVLNLKYEVIKK